MMKKELQRGLTLMEIIVSSIIVALSLMGLANLFVLGRTQIAHSRSRMAGGEIGRVFLDPLQMQVRQDTWNAGAATNDLTATAAGVRYCDGDPAHAQQAHCPPANERMLHGIGYNAEYGIDNVANTDLRRVQLTIRWQERRP